MALSSWPGPIFGQLESGMVGVNGMWVWSGPISSLGRDGLSGMGGKVGKSGSQRRLMGVYVPQGPHSGTEGEMDDAVGRRSVISMVNMITREP